MKKVYEKVYERFLHFQHKLMARAAVESATEPESNKKIRSGIVPCMIAFITGMLVFMTGEGIAIDVPMDENSLGYDIYDLAVVQILEGPIGFVGGCAAVALGGIMAVRNQILPGICSVLGGGAVIKSASITQSLGMLL